jgi:hypothetical protein
MTGIADEVKAVECVTCTRADVLCVQDLADHRDKSTSLYAATRSSGIVRRWAVTIAGMPR